jgi:hypothetical protein
MIAVVLLSLPSTVIAADDPGSLDNFHDIIVPPPVPFWPPAPGWYGVAAVLAAGLIHALWCWWRRWRANAYRRAALAELTLIGKASQAEPITGNPVAEMQTLLKRCALAAYPREIVAGLSGAAWSAFLDDRLASDNHVFRDRLGAILARGSYQQSPTSVDDSAAVLSACRHWIKHHRPLKKPLEVMPQTRNRRQDGQPVALPREVG